jgi:glucosamine-6-phosphate deaminase
MEVIIQKDAHSAAILTARIISTQLRKKPDSVLGLATGKTMELVYQLLVDFHKNEDLDFSQCHTFNLDEYVGLPSEDENSYRSYMNNNLFNKVNITITNTNIPDGMADDLDKISRYYENLIKKRGGIDLQLLGIGRTGHIGFNEPLSALRSRTRVKALTPETIKQNSPLFKNQKDIPRRAITMGVGTILESKRCLMLVTGFKKAITLKKAAEGPITSMVTASALQLHPQCTVIADEAAAELLEGKKYYRWIFENEPEWTQYQNLDG